MERSRPHRAAGRLDYRTARRREGIIMAAPVISPELQWSDANGTPYAGGTIATYVPGTSTPKATWLDPGQAALNTNPVILDAAGRSLMYGDGDYRIVLRDALGNLIFDVVASTIVSAAMAPVVAAPTIADALVLLGVNDAIAAEASARASAHSAEATPRPNADTAETTARTAADTTLQTNIDAEKTRAMAAEAAITGGSPGKIQYGTGIADGDGHKRVPFGSAYATTPSVGVTYTGVGYTPINMTVG